MKNTLLLVTLIFLTFFTCRAQQIHSIRFIHFGDESKPIGTVVISVEKNITPTDKLSDSLFGKSVRVKMETYRSIEKLIKNPKFRIANPNDSLYQDGLKIIDNQGFILYLFSQNYTPFFRELQIIVQDFADKNKIIKVFPEHY